MTYEEQKLDDELQEFILWIMDKWPANFHKINMDTMKVLLNQMGLEKSKSAMTMMMTEIHKRAK